METGEAEVRTDDMPDRMTDDSSDSFLSSDIDLPSFLERNVRSLGPATKTSLSRIGEMLSITIKEGYVLRKSLQNQQHRFVQNVGKIDEDSGFVQSDIRISDYSPSPISLRWCFEFRGA